MLRAEKACSLGRNLLLQTWATRIGRIGVVNKRFVRWKSHYEVLGVDQSASQEKIRQQFLKLSKECHPDLSKDKQGSHDKFVRLNDAYTVLSNQAKRNSYDSTLRYGSQATYQQRPPTYQHRPPHHQQNMNNYTYEEIHRKTEEAWKRAHNDPNWHRNMYQRRRQHQSKEDTDQIRFITMIIILLCTGMAFHFIAFRFITEKDKRELEIMRRQLNNKEMEAYLRQINEQEMEKIRRRKDERDLEMLRKIKTKQELEMFRRQRHEQELETMREKFNEKAETEQDSEVVRRQKNEQDLDMLRREVDGSFHLR